MTICLINFQAIPLQKVSKFLRSIVYNAVAHQRFLQLQYIFIYMYVDRQVDRLCIGNLISGMKWKDIQNTLGTQCVNYVNSISYQ